MLLLALAVSPLAAQDPEPRAVPPYRILVTNDDGVRAPGLLALARALQPLGEVTIIAPMENQSGTGHSISLGHPIYADDVSLPEGLRAVGVTATPASCVKLALAALLPEPPALVVSGINRGYNLGMVEYVSGTVGAAREAALAGVPAIAASLASDGHPHYEAAADMVRRVVEAVKARGLDPGVFLNVNVPEGAPEGLMVTRQSALAGAERFEERRSPGGRRYFWGIWAAPSADVEGTDVWATERRFVAVTPLRVGEFDPQTFARWKDLR